ncbi:MAG: glutamine synthetase [Actinobacteria bacterium]|nr:glutamine synthetase [Actinomycetota bacterium]
MNPPQIEQDALAAVAGSFGAATVPQDGPPLEGRLSLEQVERLVAEGALETVLCVTPDLWGRLVGKRLTPQTFLKTALGGEGLHASLYLFVVDMEMEPRPGYAMTGWDDGFRDCRLVPDLATLRAVPWLPRTAVVLCDPCDEQTGEPVAVAPRNLLKRQLARWAARETALKCATELEFYVFADEPRAAWERRYRELTPLSYYRADYHILQSTKDDWLMGRLRRAMDAAGIEIEFSKAEWGLGQQEVNLRYTDALEMADRHVLYKNGVKEMAALAGHAVSFMAKPAIDEVGSSCHVHASLWSADGAAPRFEADAGGAPGELLGRFIAGQAAFGRELAVLFAPNVNSYKRFQPDQFAGTNLAWGHDNRTCGLRVVGEGPALRLEHRIPGADANPYLAIAAIAAAGLAGVEQALPLPAEQRGNAAGCAAELRVPTTLREATDLFAGSEVARAAFGEEAFAHLVNFFRQELAAFDHETVTDWELVRYFERV